MFIFVRSNFKDSAEFVKFELHSEHAQFIRLPLQVKQFLFIFHGQVVISMVRSGGVRVFQVVPMAMDA